MNTKIDTRSSFKEDLVRCRKFALRATIKKDTTIRRYRLEYGIYQMEILKPSDNPAAYQDAISEQELLQRNFIDDIKNIIDELVENCYGRESVAYTLMFRMGWAEVLYWIGH